MRAQIKMGETLAILIIFFFLVVFGFSFYVRIQQSSFPRQQRENINLRAIQIAQKASFMPELQCSFKNIQIDDCIDILKLVAFGNKLQNDEEFFKYYYDTLGYSDIYVSKIYPGTATYALYTNPPDKVIEYNLSTKVPVSLYNATSKTYSFAIMSVNVYG